MVVEKRVWGGQVQQGGLFVGVIRIQLKGCDPCCWVDRMAAVQKRLTFRIEINVLQSAAVAVEC